MIILRWLSLSPNSSSTSSSPLVTTRLQFSGTPGGTKDGAIRLDKSRSVFHFSIGCRTATVAGPFPNILVSTSYGSSRVVPKRLVTSTSYQFMTRMGKSVYHEGLLVDSGIDLIMESGMAEHTKDLILFTAIVKTCSLLSNYFWLLLLLAPGRLLYILWVNFIGPWFFSSAEPRQVDDKKQRKMERKMKQQQVYR